MAAKKQQPRTMTEAEAITLARDGRLGIRIPSASGAARHPAFGACVSDGVFRVNLGKASAAIAMTDPAGWPGAMPPTLIAIDAPPVYAPPPKTPPAATPTTTAQPSEE